MTIGKIIALTAQTFVGKVMSLLFHMLSRLVHSEGDHPWDFFGRNDAKAETPVVWPLHAKS